MAKTNLSFFFLKQIFFFLRTTVGSMVGFEIHVWNVKLHLFYAVQYSSNDDKIMATIPMSWNSLCLFEHFIGLHALI